MSQLLSVARKASVPVFAVWLFLFLCISFVSAHSQQVVYVNTLNVSGGPEGKVVQALAFDRQGNIRVAGTDAAFVTKLDPTGQKILYRTFLSGAAADRAEALAVASDGSLYAAGTDYSAGPEAGGFLAKLNAAGEQMWFRPLSTPAIGVVVDAQGSVYYASATKVSKLDSFEVAAPAPARSLAINAGGEVWLGGDGYVARLNSAEERWDAILHLPNASVRAVAFDASGVPGHSGGRELRGVCRAR